MSMCHSNLLFAFFSTEMEGSQLANTSHDSTNQPYDMKNVISAIVDKSNLSTEFQTLTFSEYSLQ